MKIQVINLNSFSYFVYIHGSQVDSTRTACQVSYTTKIQIKINEKL